MLKDNQVADLIRIDVKAIVEDTLEQKASNRRSRAPTTRRIQVTRLTGQVRPVAVQPAGTEGQFRILAGRLYWQAALAAGLPRISAYECRDSQLSAALEALEQLVRLPGRNPIDTAKALQSVQRLIPHCTRLDLADLCGWPQNTVVHYLLLLNLPAPVRRLIEEGRLSFGHGKVLTGKALNDQPERQQTLAADSVRKRWSVRTLEAVIKGDAVPAVFEKTKAAPQAAAVMTDPNITRLANTLSEATGLPTTIEHRADGQGRVVFAYHSLDEMDNLLRFFPLQQ